MPTPDVVSRGQLFDPVLVTDLINKVKGKSAIAQLSTSKPIPFNGMKEFTFSMDSEVDLVAENGAKSRGALALAPRTIMPLKVEYGARISDEFIYASEEARIDILKSFNEGFAKKVARGLDIMAFHGVNPRTGSASTLIGTNCFDGAVTTNVVTADDDTDANAQVEAAIALIQGGEFDVTGMAMAPAFRSALAAIVKTDGNPMFPELKWGAEPGTINGLPVQNNSTVSFGGSDDLAILGDFESNFKWGYSKSIGTEIIRYGDPDNSGRDLKGYNQIYIRAEMYLGWAVFDPLAFAIIKADDDDGT